jgi:2-polyprenyl-3-methyl-5-hydroxy-6-metoxy-1,4-benzoquinol methylase
MRPLPLSQRRLRPEIMDDPHIERSEHHQALNGLRRLNRASGIGRQMWQEIVSSRCVARGDRLRVLDVASGGGDVPLELWKRAQARRIQLQLLGVDVSAEACEYARQRCKEAGDVISFRQLDVTRDPLPTGFDVVTCSLFLHHLTFAQASRLLGEMAAAGRLMLVSDLRRSAAGYALAHIACRVLTRSPIVHFDGPRSVANAFSVHEMRELCRAAGLAGAAVRLRARWPCRLMVIHQGS